MLLFIAHESGVGRWVGSEWPQDAVLIYFAAHGAVFRSRTGQMRRLEAGINMWEEIPVRPSTWRNQYMDGPKVHSGRLGEASGWPFNLKELVNSVHTRCKLSFSYSSKVALLQSHHALGQSSYK